MSGLVVIELFPARSRAIRGWRRELEVDNGGAEVEACSTGDDCNSRGLDELVDRAVSELGILADRELVREVADGDEPSRPGGLVREDWQAAVDLQRVRRDDLAAELIGDELRDGGLS